MGFLALWTDSLRALLRDKGVALLVFGAPVLYGFFYPWFYGNEVVQRVPVAVVVQDASGLARQMLRFAQASPRIDPQIVTGDEGIAQQALLRGEVGLRADPTRPQARRGARCRRGGAGLRQRRLSAGE